MRRSLGKWIILFLFLSILVFLGTSDLTMPGQDEHVNGIADKYAQEVGAGEREPYINTDRGDLLLFVFALGGATAGFIIGYNWRDIFGKPSAPSKYQIVKSSH
ncbi:hypothetical protein [Desulfosporosinus sp. OT]|uniref:hypothetical protein n=1 Tax=Desulfosporosinus sp. OT TaxID=913865 RepID=UPI0002239EFD|nr:hypothetical protein [Desulfosporosinus sp. OT]EGW36634.1 hypothetical protein DOT_5499 [Desulfosporosinus sp. OT]